MKLHYSLADTVGKTEGGKLRHAPANMLALAVI